MSNDKRTVQVTFVVEYQEDKMLYLKSHFIYRM